MRRKVYQYLTVDVDDEAWLWTTDDLFRTKLGDWFPRKGKWRDMGAFIDPKLIPPALLKKAKTQVVKIVIKEAQT